MNRIRVQTLLIAGACAGLAVAGVCYAAFSGGGAGAGTFNQAVSTAQLAPPTSVTVPGSSGSPVHVTWTGTSAPPGGNVDGYYVQRYSGASPSDACGTTTSSLLSGSATSCNDTVLSNGTYTYKVTAYWRSWTAQSTASGSVVVNLTTTVTDPSPTTGNVGSSVTITGVGFLASHAVTVTVGGTSASITSGSTSDGSGNVNITFTVPAKVAGSYQVLVSDGTNSAAANTNFTITRSISLNPTSGHVAATVTVSGSAFPASSAASATWDGGALTISGTTTDSSGSFSGTTFTVPTATAGSHTVQFSVSGQTASATFTVTPAISLSASSGNTGATITVSGNGFAGTSNLSATWDGGALTLSPTTPTTNSSGTVPGSVTFTVPAATFGAHTVTLTDASSNNASATYTVSAAISLSSSSGNAGTSITISGTGFAASSSLTATWDGGTLTLSPASPTTSSVGSVPGSVTFRVPGSTAAAHTVQVTDGSSHSASATFTTTFPACTSATSTKDYVSVATGNWGTNATWYSCSNSGSWGAAGATPTSADGNVTIQSGNTVTVAVNVTADQVTVATGGDVEVSGSVTWSINRGSGTYDLAISGIVNVSGTLTQQTASTGSFVGVQSGGTLDIKNGGTINGSGGNGGTAPTLTVESGGQWTIDSGGTMSSSGTAQTELTVNSGGTATINGSVTAGTSGIATTFNGTVTSSADITLKSVSDLEIGGTMTVTGGTITTTRGNSGSIGSINNAGSLILQNSSVLATGTGTFTVASGGTFDMGPSAIVNGSGKLSVASGSTLKVGSADGIIDSTTTLGNVRTSGADTYSTGANYTYDGTAGQTTGSAMPTTVNNLTISNSSGVTLSGNVTVSANLALTSGNLSTSANTVTEAAAATTSGTTDVVGNFTRSTPGTATLTYGNPNVQLTFSATAPTSVNVKLVLSAPAAKTGAVTRTYTITPTGGSGYTATVRLHYLDAELNGNTEGSLQLWALVSGTWTAQGQTSRDSTNNYVEKTGVSAATVANDWTIAN